MPAALVAVLRLTGNHILFVRAFSSVSEWTLDVAVVFNRTKYHESWSLLGELIYFCVITRKSVLVSETFNILYFFNIFLILCFAQTFLKLNAKYRYISYFDIHVNASYMYSLLSLHFTPGFHAQYVRDHVNRSSRNREVIPKCKGGSLDGAHYRL